jgi:hypothetical protein
VLGTPSISKADMMSRASASSSVGLLTLEGPDQTAASPAAASPAAGAARADAPPEDVLPACKKARAMSGAAATPPAPAGRKPSARAAQRAANAAAKLLEG